ncbi:MAG TPA: FIST N-terminal domain-containing protein [Acidimicrobiales bacterium]|nr:FIST N-terminal domain-containing protein [Acidimicrobiales bacterium]
MMFASALSEHPDPAEATGEVVGTVLERLGTGPDLAVLFCSPQHRDAVGDIAASIRRLLRPGVLLGATAVAVLGGAREVEDAPAVGLWAGRLAAPARPVRLDAVRTASGIALQGLSGSTFEPGDTLLLLADPFSLPVDAIIDALAELEPPGAHGPLAVPVVGGMASAAATPGGNRLVLDDEVVSSGGVGVVLPDRVAATAIVSQGCRPIGDPMIVTRAEGNLVLEIAGRPALDRLDDLVRSVDAEERALLASGLQIGIAIDEHQDTFGRGDFLVRSVMGADRRHRALAVGDRVEVGTTVQFQVRDAVAADEDLRALLAGATGDAALVFTCNGRGQRLFDEPDHDARVVHDALGSPALAGMFCAGEIGPVGGRSFIHGFTASVLLFQGKTVTPAQPPPAGH